MSIVTASAEEMATRAAKRMANRLVVFISRFAGTWTGRNPGRITTSVGTHPPVCLTPGGKFLIFSGIDGWLGSNEVSPQTVATGGSLTLDPSHPSPLLNYECAAIHSRMSCGVSSSRFIVGSTSCSSLSGSHRSAIESTIMSGW